jgi:hypothetical protein
MRQCLLSFALLCLGLPAGFAGTLAITPTTTLSAETSNNTSAANSFQEQSNGDIGASNISKLDIHTLLYPGVTAKIYAHLMLWFGGPSPMNVGYKSNDAAQVHRQIEDMISRGIDGVIMDWYGPGNFVDGVAKLVMAEAESHPGFTFAIMVDKGAIQWNSCSGCNPQQALIKQIQYVEDTYFPSPSYMRINGKPVITNFDLDLHFTLDWNAVNAAVGGTPLYIFQHSEGFTHALSGGSYAWVEPTTNDFANSYLTKFYTAGQAVPQEETIGGAYKGFNDTLASWSMKRIMSQQCGQTWLGTFDKINSIYNSGHQLGGLQLVTWNDYQEGTELETGIDNCVSVASNVSGSSLRWNISGNENTIDHYVVYISKDGQNLMALNTIAPGSRSLNLSSYSLAPGSYIFYVQAVGKATLKNQMSAAVSYTVQGAAGLKVALAASPSAIIIKSGQSASASITVTPESVPFNGTVSLSCSGFPVGLSCSFSPQSVVPGSRSVGSVLTISAITVASVPNTNDLPGRQLLRSAGFLGLGIPGLVLFGQQRRKKVMIPVLSFLLICGMLLLSSCGGGGQISRASQSSTPGVPLGTFTVAVTGSSGGLQTVTTISLTVH